MDIGFWIETDAKNNLDIYVVVYYEIKRFSIFSFLGE
jgi:hypothetical protein